MATLSCRPTPSLQYGPQPKLPTVPGAGEGGRPTTLGQSRERRVVRMAKFDKQLAHWREQHRLAVEDLEDLQSGRKKMAEDTGAGWIDAIHRWTGRVRNEVVVFA